MDKLRAYAKGFFSPVTIMLVPHTSCDSYRVRVPFASLVVVGVLCLLGAGYVYSVIDDAFNYEPTRKELDYYKQQFVDLEDTIASLNMAEGEFRELFSLDSREDVLESVNFSDSGSLDMQYLRKQIDKAILNVGEIRDYLSESRDLYMATPMGLPVDGWMTSGYGYRMHPIKKIRDFHSGVDISSSPGNPVRATADGIVSFSARSGANGNLVAIEHGFGYSTYYAHSKKNAVKLGQVVKRGDVIAYVGSTGSSTGPHVHYEVWKNGHNVNPLPFIKGAEWERTASSSLSGAELR